MRLLQEKQRKLAFVMESVKGLDLRLLISQKFEKSHVLFFFFSFITQPLHSFLIISEVICVYSEPLEVSMVLINAAAFGF